MTSRQVGSVGRNWLIQNSEHAIVDELEVLWPMQSSEEVTIIVLLYNDGTTFRNGVQQNDEEKLQSIGDEDLLRILENYVVVGHSPASGIIFESLQHSAKKRSARYTTYRVKQRAQDG